MNTFLEIEGLVLNTFSFLEIKDVVHTSLVCKRWNRLANVEVIWENLYSQRFHTKNYSFPSLWDNGWKSRYKQRLSIENKHFPTINQQASTIPTTSTDYRNLADLLVDTAVQEPKLYERRIMYQVASECYASSYALNNTSDLLLSWGYLYQDLIHSIQRKSHFPYLVNLHDSPSEFDSKEEKLRDIVTEMTTGFPKDPLRITITRSVLLELCTQLHKIAIRLFKNALKGFQKELENVEEDIKKICTIKKESSSEESIKDFESLSLVKSGLKCSYMFAYERLGRDYLKLAEFQQNEDELEKYWQKAVNVLENAIKQDPENEAIMRSLCDAYRLRAEQVAEIDESKSFKFFEKTKEMLNKLLDKFQEDTDILNDLALLHIIQGKTCMNLNKKEEEEKNFTQANILLKRLKHLGYEFARYNLACLYSLQNKHKSCKKLLEKLVSNNQLFMSDLLDEEDFKNVRSLPWFLELIETVKENNKLERNLTTFDYA